ncbi:MAG: hypothetical protein ACLQHF_06575 [Terracidiphilus sp.]
MEIAPIPGIRAIAANRMPRPDSDLSPAFDIDALSKMGDGAAGMRVNKAAGAEEDDEELDLAEEDERAQDSPGVNYFA